MKRSFFFLWLACPFGLRSPHCWGLEITFRHTTFGRTPLDEWSTPPQRSLLNNTQHWQETDIQDLGEVRTRNPSKQEATDPRLRPRGHWNRHENEFFWSNEYIRRRKICYLKSLLLFRDTGTGCVISLLLSYTPNCRRQRHLAYRIWIRAIISCSSRTLNQFHALVKVMAERMWNRNVGKFLR
jgi:hypothetical protein